MLRWGVGEGRFDTETIDWMSEDLNSEPGTALTSHVASDEPPSWASMSSPRKVYEPGDDKGNKQQTNTHIARYYNVTW